MSNTNACASRILLETNRKACYSLERSFEKHLSTAQRRVMVRKLGLPNVSPRTWGKDSSGTVDMTLRAKRLCDAVLYVRDNLSSRQIDLREGHPDEDYLVYTIVDNIASAEGVYPFELSYAEPEPTVPEPEPTAPEPTPEPEVLAEVHPMVSTRPPEGLKDVWNSLGISDAVSLAVQEVMPEIIKQASSGVQVVEHRVPSPKGIRVMEGVFHTAFKRCTDVIRLQDQTNSWVWLYGPSGTGKTHMAKQMAEAMDLRFAAASCNPGMAASELLGWLLPLGKNGEFTHVQATFLDFVRNGGVFLLDEFANVSPDVSVSLGMMLANLEMWVAKAIDDPHVKVHEDFRLVVADNTRGVGSTSGFVRNQQDSAIRNRFQFRRIGYDKDLEKALYGDDPLWLKAVWGLRQKAKDLGISEEVGSRQISQGRALRGAYGKDEYSVEYCMQLLTEGWSDDDRSKVSVSALS